MKKLILVSIIVLLASCAEKAPQKGALIFWQASGLDSNDTITAVLYQEVSGIGKVSVIAKSDSHAIRILTMSNQKKAVNNDGIKA